MTISKMYGTAVIFFKYLRSGSGEIKKSPLIPPFPAPETEKTLLTAPSGSGTDKEPLNLLENNGIGCKVTPDCL